MVTLKIQETVPFTFALPNLQAPFLTIRNSEQIQPNVKHTWDQRSSIDARAL